MGECSPRPRVPLRCPYRSYQSLLKFLKVRELAAPLWSESCPHLPQKPAPSLAPWSPRSPSGPGAFLGGACRSMGTEQSSSLPVCGRVGLLLGLAGSSVLAVLP